jgi:hypothetical protein
VAESGPEADGVSAISSCMVPFYSLCISAARILKNKAGRDVTGTRWNWSQAREAFVDPQLYFSVVNAFLSSVPNGSASSVLAV